MRIALLLDAYKPIINGITTFVSLHNTRWKKPAMSHR